MEIHGRDICGLGGRDLRAAQREVAIIFQQLNLIRRLSGTDARAVDQIDERSVAPVGGGAGA